MEVAKARALQAAPEWQVWVALWIVYIVWGSTYLGIRLLVETAPPMLSTGLRFFIAGTLIYLWLLIRRGRAGVRLEPRQLAAAAAVGVLFVPCAPGLVSVAEQKIPSSFAALIFASIPLWIVLWRLLAGERPHRVTLIGVAAGYVGVAILVLPDDRPAGVTVGGALLVMAAAFSWSIGSFWSPRLPLPEDAFLSTAATIMCGGLAAITVGLIAGEGSDFHPSQISGRSLFGFIYLILIGSVVAFNAYVWLLKHAPISRVATYAYVNPVVALLLGSLILSEQITATSLLGAAVIVASVAWVVSRESGDPGAGEGNVSPPGAGEEGVEAESAQR